MPIALESVARLRVDAALYLQTTREIIVRLERIRKAVRGKARRFHGDLRIHAEERLVEEHLQHCLNLHVATRRPERHHRFASPNCYSGIRGEPRPFTRSETACVRRIR